MNDYKEFMEESGKFKELKSRVIRPGSIKSLNLNEGQLVKETVYTIQETVSPKRDVIFPFYLPNDIKQIYYIYLNLYFPGLQDGDYPKNSPIIYIPYIDKSCLEQANGGTVGFNTSGTVFAGTGAYSGTYVWYRGFGRFNISPLFGFKLTSASLKWTLAWKEIKGSGANSQHSIVLHAINDYGDADKNDWSLATQVNYGNVNLYTDTNGLVYSKDVKTRLQALLDASTNYACFRWVSSSEPTDGTNAIFYNYSNALLYCELSEDTDEPVCVYADSGPGFGSMIDSFKAAKEGLDLKRFFKGSGKKQLKFSCNKTRRVDVLLRIGLRTV